MFADTPEEHTWACVQTRSVEEKTTRELFGAIFVLNEVGELVKAKMPREREREFNPRRRLS
ncbi:MAG: hypothetical protein WC880_03850 [Candidatus Paceibacterota bacterium]